MGLLWMNVVSKGKASRCYRSDFFVLDLESDALRRKMRLLVFASIGFQRIGQKLSYSEIAKALQIQISEVERYTVDGKFICLVKVTIELELIPLSVIRADLLSGRLSQDSKTLHVIRACPRGFGAEQWKALEQRLMVWKAGLSGIQTVLTSAIQNSKSIPGMVNGTDRGALSQHQPA